MRDFQPLASNLNHGLEFFGFDDLRPGQPEPISRVLDGGDTLVVMPTGSGKSLCYQLPALLLDGVTIVVSPLIALMKDQVDALAARKIPATFINSSVSSAEQRDRILGMENGEYRLVYVAPERFRSSQFVRALKSVPLRLFAVDEAHCISEWGHDFRPDYRKLKDVRRELGSPTTIALTATATPDVQKDIVAELGLDDSQTFVSGFERENLSFEIAHVRGRDEKEQRLIALIDHHKDQSVVVYCATRKQTEEVQSALKKKKIAAGIYHGGLSDKARAAQQDAWICGEVPVLVATNAFGMGVDKSDVRAVVHYNMPGSLEAYYQEAGRAGRDGEPANCLLLFNFADKGIHEFFTENSFPSRRATERVWEVLQANGTGTHLINLKDLGRNASTGSEKLHAMGLETIIRSLQYAGHLETSVRDGFRSVTIFDTGDLNVDWSHNKKRREIATRQLRDVIQYASTKGCRQEAIVRYFGGRPTFGKKCGVCDFCAGTPEYARLSFEKNARQISLRADDALTVIRKTLAGVARAKGRRGAHAVAGMLVGSNAKNVKEAKFDKLSTYKILQHMKRDDVVYVIDLCVKFGWVARNEHGCVSVTTLGGEVMREEREPDEDAQSVLDATFTTRSIRRKPTSKTAGDSYSGSGDTYLETLRLHRDGMSYKEIAKTRDLTTQTILRHLQKLTLDGESIDVSEEIDHALLEKVRGVASEWNLHDREKPLIEALDGACTYDQLRLHLIPLLAERVK